MRSPELGFVKNAQNPAKLQVWRTSGCDAAWWWWWWWWWWWYVVNEYVRCYNSEKGRKQSPVGMFCVTQPHTPLYSITLATTIVRNT